MEWIAIEEGVPFVQEGEAKEIFVTVERAHNGKRYSFTAQYLNQMELENGEGYCEVYTGWCSVKEHSEYDRWYEPLIDESSGDKVVAWMGVPEPYEGITK